MVKCFSKRLSDSSFFKITSGHNSIFILFVEEFARIKLLATISVKVQYIVNFLSVVTLSGYTSLC